MQRFDTVADEWDKSDRRRALAHTVARAIMDNVTITPSMRVLDFGCGTGLLSEPFMDTLTHITGLDTSQNMLENYKAKFGARCSVLQHDLLATPLEKRYDLIVSSMTLHHIEDTKRILERFYEHLAPNGSVAIADLCTEDGRFHDHGNEGVYHFGFEEEKIRMQCADVGLHVSFFETLFQIEKEDRSYAVFLLIAAKE